MIDVCPVGALTDKTFRFKSRVWFSKPTMHTEIVYLFWKNWYGCLVTKFSVLQEEKMNTMK
jgi:hypothetical protein